MPGQGLKPILFNTEMVQAIMEGRKYVTRRLIKPQPGFFYDHGGVIQDHDNPEHIAFLVMMPDGSEEIYVPPYQPGDILYVRETWCKGKVAYGEEPDGRCVPFISQCPGEDDIIPKEWAIREDIGIEDVVWRPSIHMPKEAARIFLRVTHVRLKWLQTITGDECAMEGVWPLYAGPIGGREAYYKEAFAKLWNSTIKPADLDAYGWDANPWVWVIRFERCEKPQEVDEDGK